MSESCPSTISSGATQSCWLKTPLPNLSFFKLQENLNTDVIIVGGGIAGLTCAYKLVSEGKKVIVLEDGNLASGETGRTTAHLTNALDDRYFVIAKNHGKDLAKYAAESHTAAIDLIEEIVIKESIDCDFQRVEGYLMLAEDDDPDVLRKEFDAARDAGLLVNFEERIPVDCFESGPVLKFPKQGQFHPGKYISGLANAIMRMGGSIFTNTHVSEFSSYKDHTEVVTHDGFKVTAKHMIVATNVPVNDRVTLVSKWEPWRSYVITVKVPKGSIKPMLIWDTLEDGYHYVRTAPIDSEYDLLIVGGEDHIVGRETNYDERFQRLLAWTKSRFPQASGIVDKWSGQIIEPVDDVAFIGRNPGDHNNVFVVTGDSGNGMTHGTIAGILITDLIFNRANPWEKLYDPSRKPMHEIGEFIKHNTKTQLQYKDWLTGGQVSDIEEIPRCKGAIIRDGLSKVAVYKDENGKVHACSAVCPHLGGIVTWNDLEKSWDCPVHGSRFDHLGNVINGPSVNNLCPAQEFETKAALKAEKQSVAPPVTTNRIDADLRR